MNKITNSFTLLVVLLLPFFCSGQDLEWAKNLGGTGEVISKTITVDDSGNVFVVGRFNGTADFDPGAPVYNLSSPSGQSLFVCKISSKGDFRWARKFTGPSIGEVYVATDSQGNVLVLGTFTDTCDFDPGTSVFNLISSGSRDIFLCKLSVSGQFLWAESYGTTGSDDGSAVTVDSFDNVFLAGQFSGGDPFISKINPNGNEDWTKVISTPMGLAGTEALCIGDSGNIYFTGRFYGTVDFDPGLTTYNQTSTGQYDTYIAKWDSSGNFIWTISIEGVYMEYVYSVAVDSAGGVYIGGYFYGTADFDPGNGVYNLVPSGEEAYVAKYSATGDFLWAKMTNSANSSRGYALALDQSGNSYMTGYFFMTTDFDPGPGNFSLTAGGWDPFILKLDSYGNFVWAKQFFSSFGNDEGHSIVLDHQEAIITTGEFSNTADFDPDTSVFNLTASGNKDAYIVKLNACSVNHSIINLSTCYSYTSPSGRHTWYSTGSYSDTLLNKGGCDSIIHINLVINDSSSSILNIAACNQYTSPSGRYSWNTSGIYSDTIINNVGCDSIISINLTINSSSDSTQQIAACNQYISPSGSYVWTSSGTYMDTIPNHVGCDSIVRTLLSITVIDTGIYVNGDRLMANADSAQYQWINCSTGQIISGEVNKEFIPQQNGKYQVAIGKDGCWDTSACITVNDIKVEKYSVDHNIRVFPNPTQEVIQIEFPQEKSYLQLIVYTVSGDKILQHNFQEERRIEVRLPESEGIYFLKFLSVDGKSTVLKVIKE